MPSIKCGYCKQTHASVADVRNCALQETPAYRHGSLREAPGVATLERPTGASVVRRTRNARQDLDLRHDPAAAENFLGNVASGQPRAAARDNQWVRDFKAAATKVPEGRYALWTGSKDDEGREIYHFFKVDKPEDGKWKGYTFVKGINPGAGEEWAIKGAKALEILEKVGQDPEQSSVWYGKATNRCGVCNRELSNPESVERGIGPVCWENTF